MEVVRWSLDDVVAACQEETRRFRRGERMSDVVDANRGY